MSKTLDDIFIESFDAKLPIVNDDLTLAHEFIKKLKQNNIEPDDERLVYVMKTVDTGDVVQVDEHCTSQTNIIVANDRLFSLMWLDNGYEQYATELDEVKAVQKVITIYQKI